MVKNWDRDRLVIYSVHWSDGKITSAEMFPESVPEWAWESIAVERKKVPLLNIEKVVNPKGIVVWPQEEPRNQRAHETLKEFCIGVVGWLWLAGIVAALIFLVRAAFLGGSWWWFLVVLAGTLVLWRASHYYYLERQKEMERAAMLRRPQ